MAWKYKDFNYADYISKYGDQIKNTKSQIDSLYSQINNFDNTYDHTKDAGWIAANNQIQSDAQIAESKARGKMGNRIGTTSSWEDSVASSIQTDALKNSQNLIPTYKDAALNKLNNQYSLLQNQYNNLLSLDQQDYSKYLNGRDFAYNKYTSDKNFDYQQYLNDENNRIASENAKAAQIKAESEAKAKELESQYKLAQLNAENGTNYVINPNTGKLYNPAKATAFKKAIWSEDQFNNSATMKKRYGDYDGYRMNMIALGYQRGNLTAEDVNYLKTLYNY